MPFSVMEETYSVIMTREERPSAYWCFLPVKKRGPGMKEGFDIGDTKVIPFRKVVYFSFCLPIYSIFGRS